MAASSTDRPAPAAVRVGRGRSPCRSRCSRSSCGGGPVAVSYDGPTAGWPSYGGDPGGMRYSPLTQIDRGQRRGSSRWRGPSTPARSSAIVRFAFEVTPILVGERLVFCTPWNRVIALDPETGAELWRFDPELDPSIYYANQFICRGVSAWTDPEAAAGAACRDRLFMGTNDGRLMSIDAATGARCDGFGEGGEVDLTIGVGEIQRKGDYQVTSPPAIARGLVITGSAINDNQRTDAPSGVVRAYDARTGALRWAWDAVAPPIEDERRGRARRRGGRATSIAARPPARHRADPGRRAPPTCGR